MLEYEKILKEYIDRDDRLMVLTAENRAPLRNLASQIGDRFLDTGITEQSMIGIAAGLALRGRRPVCHALAAFLTMRAFEFIRTDVGIPGLPVKIVGYVPGVLSDGNGPTHQAIEDVSLMRGIPGMQVFCPADEQELGQGMRAVLDSDQPCYIRWNIQKPVYEHREPFALGKAETVMTGIDITFLTYGALFGQTYEAARLLQADGVSVGLVNLRTLSPVDEAALVAAAQGSRLLVTVEDHFVRGGLATILAETLTRHRQLAHILNIGFEQKWFKPALLADVLEHEGLTGKQLAGRALRVFKEI